jgi:hypothetical protein
MDQNTVVVPIVQCPNGRKEGSKDGLSANVYVGLVMLGRANQGGGQARTILRYSHNLCFLVQGHVKLGQEKY